MYLASFPFMNILFIKFSAIATCAAINIIYIYMSLNISALYSRTGITESKDSVYFSICFKISAFHKMIGNLLSTSNICESAHSS